MVSKDLTDKEMTIYNQGFKSGQQHTQPSSTTLTLIKNMEERMDEFHKTLKELPTKADLENTILKSINSVMEKIEEKFVTKSSFKPVQLVAYGMVSLIAGGMVTMIIYYITTK